MFQYLQNRLQFIEMCPQPQNNYRRGSNTREKRNVRNLHQAER